VNSFYLIKTKRLHQATTRVVLSLWLDVFWLVM
jgi:hypothetical protein